MKNKNIIGLSVYLLLMISIFLIKGVSVEAYIGSVFSYTINNQTITYKVLSEPTETNNGTVEVIYDADTNKNLNGDVIIPSTVTNKNMPYDVTQIGSNAFWEASQVTTIKLPDKIIQIGSNAFSDCSNLTSINIPEGVTRIEDYTFYNCINLNNINLPNEVTYIGRNAFTSCSKLKTINLPTGIKEIGSGAFWGCGSLTEVVIPEGVTSIENNLFKDCSNLTTVRLPESITSIGKNAFYNCSNLLSIHMSDAITSIGEYAFYNCSSLTSIKIPYRVTNIEARTFFNCASLNNIRISDNVTSIGELAFYGCSSLTNIKLPDKLNSIGNYVFYGCDRLRPMTIPLNVTSIGYGEFPYSGVYVYHNSYAETYFKSNYPNYYQIVKVPLEEMTFSDDIININLNDSITLNLDFYPAYSSDITDRVVWSSSNASVVTVGTNGKIKGIAAGEADITAVMGNYTATTHIIVDGEVINPTFIALHSNDVTMKKGDSIRLNVDFSPMESTNHTISWKSSDSTVVSVLNGRIIANNSGTAIITAVSSAGISTTCRITVINPLQEIYTDYDEIVLDKGETKKISISYYPMDTTDNKTAVLKSEDESIVTTDNGVITAVKPGSTIITVTVGAHTLNIPVTVKVPVKAISFKQSEVTLTVGQTKIVPLIVTPEDTTENVVITSSDETVATYSDGVITAKKSGVATITAVCGTLTTTSQVTVVTDIKSISLNQTNLSLTLGKKTTLVATINPTNVVDDKTIVWASSNKSVVTIDSKGIIQTVGVGKATITATVAGNIKAISSVTVKLIAPTWLKASSTGYNSVKITWSSVSGASGYQIYRAESKSGKYKWIKNTTLKSYTDKTVKTGNTYYYKVRAIRYQGNKKIYSSYSYIDPAKPIPTTPAKVKLVKLSSSKISFTWNKVSGASGYEVYRASSKNKSYQKVTSTTSLHYINYGLSKGRTLYYKVRAYKMVGNKKVYSYFSKVYSIKM